MKLFADHVAEKHVNTLMRECISSSKALMVVMTFEVCCFAYDCESEPKKIFLSQNECYVCPADSCPGKHVSFDLDKRTEPKKI